MSTSYCQFCSKEHDDHTWRNTNMTNDKGEVISGWFCTKAFKPSNSKEWIPEYIKEDRSKYEKSTLQPFREGVASREFIEAYPERAKQTFTPQDMSKAKYVWQGDVISKHWRNSQ